MKILVVDIAAETGGAVTVLEQFCKKFENDISNEYVIILSKIEHKDTYNVKYINVGWVKKSYLHRLFFDKFYIKSIIKKVKPDKVLSLQNNAFSVGKIEQEVFFHNALLITDKRFRFFQSRQLWIYQNIIGKLTKRSLKKAGQVDVQAEWIKHAISKRWNIDEKKIVVMSPKVAICDKGRLVRNDNPQRLDLFYPANGSLYKNHIALLKACVLIWNQYADYEKASNLTLTLTCSKERLSWDCRRLLSTENYPVVFVGKLSQKEMVDMYTRTVLVFPSYLETVGLPLLEAQQCGCEILAADCEYAHDAVGRYANVQFFDPFDILALSEKLHEMINKIVNQ